MKAELSTWGTRITAPALVEKADKASPSVRVFLSAEGWRWRRGALDGGPFDTREAAWSNAAARNLDVPLGNFTGEQHAGVVAV